MGPDPQRGPLGGGNLDGLQVINSGTCRAGLRQLQYPKGKADAVLAWVMGMCGIAALLTITAFFALA